MEATLEGPRVKKHRVENARVILGIPSEVVLPDLNAALCHLSTERVVRVPERICRAIGLPRGGGAVFLQRDDAVELMSDKSFADRADPMGEEGESNERP